MMEAVKVSTCLMVLCLAACPEPSVSTGGTSGDDDTGMEPTEDPGDPRDDPFIADINNNWTGSLRAIQYSLTFMAALSGKSASAVIGGFGSNPFTGDRFEVDGLFHDHMIHFTMRQGSNVLTFDGVFVDVETMHLTVGETLTHLVLHCSTVGGRCM